jgi:hypothetical protein
VEGRRIGAPHAVVRGIGVGTKPHKAAKVAALHNPVSVKPVNLAALQEAVNVVKMMMIAVKVLLLPTVAQGARMVVTVRVATWWTAAAVKASILVARVASAQEEVVRVVEMKGVAAAAAAAAAALTIVVHVVKIRRLVKVQPPQRTLAEVAELMVVHTGKAAAVGKVGNAHAMYSFMGARTWGGSC